MSRYDTNNKNIGKLQPQAIDLEEAVLGAILIQKNCLMDIADILKPEIFYKESNQKICKAVLSLLFKNEPIDILTIVSELRATGELEIVGGAYYITELTNRVASAANIEYHIRIVHQKYLQRELIRISSEAIEEAYEDTSDILDLLSRSQIQKDAMLETLIFQKETSNAELYDTTITQLKSVGQSLTGITGVPSGFIDLDKITGGFQKSDLIILAARPSMGKTSMALQILTNAAIRFGLPVAVFSLEMSKVQLMHKELSIETSIPLWKFKKNCLNSEDWSRVNDFERILKSAPIFWDDTSALSVMGFVAKARKLKRKHNIQLIVIDYLQLLKGFTQRGGNREQEISNISRTLKAVAKELDIPIIALSQLSRKVEERLDKRPLLSDLRESGSIEQDADIVLFLYRDEYYKIEIDKDGYSTAGLAEVVIAKHRNGATDDVVLKFNKKTTGFSDDVDFEPSNQLPNNFIIRPSQMQDDDDDYTPF